jgi:hypothetical protein
MFAILII